MKKQIMSIAAIAAIFTTGVNAFDAQRTTGTIGLETSTTGFTKATMNTTNISPIPAALTSTSQAGDALIFPAYYSQKGWSTEFSVINNSSTEGVIAKVVLYSAKDSKELRDFNIYLSQNDVFRATIKDGKLTSTDSSTRALAQDVVSISTVAKTGYIRKDTAPMASSSKPFETPVSEAVGYIAVFAMAQADSDKNGDTYSGYAGYHKKHNQLWKDYRHMLDQCRGEGWRTTSNNYGGIFRTAAMSTPNVQLDGANQVADANTLTECGTVYTTQYTGKTKRKVEFKSPDMNVLSGSVLVSADDSKGTRSVLLQATPIDNFTDGAKAGMLWTEGELANIADRCLVAGNTGSEIKYDTACLAADIANFNIARTNYEFRDAENTELLITQPYKRVLVQIEDRRTTGGNYQNVPAFRNYFNYYNKSTKRAKVGTSLRNVTNYGQFDLASPAIYDDNENLSTSTSDGYIVSPAPIQSQTPGIPNELSVFNPLGAYSDSKSGFATIKYTANAHGIVTQMAASEVGSTSEVNWIYPVTN
jgi:hypothetical protein